MQPVIYEPRDRAIVKQGLREAAGLAEVSP
jgi:hypothetical protein